MQVAESRQLTTKFPGPIKQRLPVSNTTGKEPQERNSRSFPLKKKRNTSTNGIKLSITGRKYVFRFTGCKYVFRFIYEYSARVGLLLLQHGSQAFVEHNSHRYSRTGLCIVLSCKRSPICHQKKQPV